ncbi:MAG: hypothetical protein CSB44_00330 [Gammaproteobacteria bacterium]|nr:MAG: hypothetical protein CSB44_00330 [Gammaproteobacteria bacterium]
MEHGLWLIAWLHVCFAEGCLIDTVDTLDLEPVEHRLALGFENALVRKVLLQYRECAVGADSRIDAVVVLPVLEFVEFNRAFEGCRADVALAETDAAVDGCAGRVVSIGEAAVVELPVGNRRVGARSVDFRTLARCHAGTAAFGAGNFHGVGDRFDIAVHVDADLASRCGWVHGFHTKAFDQ